MFINVSSGTKEINPSVGMLGYLHIVNLNHVLYILLQYRGYIYIHKSLHIFKHSFEF